MKNKLAVSFFGLLLLISLFFMPAVHALKITGITFNVTNSTYGQYNMITLKVIGNQTGYNVAIYNFNKTSFDGTSFINRTTISNDTLTHINITALIAAGGGYNLTMNISNSTLAGTTVKYNLTTPCSGTIHCFFKVTPATPTITLTPASNSTYNGSAFASTFEVSTINNQLTASLYVNGVKATLFSNTVIDSPISVGNQPMGVAITPNGKFAYVTNNGGNTVSVINTTSNTVISSAISVGSGPIGIAITPNGKFAYVVNNGGNNVSVINTTSNTVIGSPIPVRSMPYGIAITPNGKFAYVVNGNNNTVSVINTTSNTVIGSAISVGDSPLGIAITPNGKFAYVTNNGGNTVSVINTTSNTVITTISVAGGPLGIAITPNGKFAYIADYFANNVSVINTTSNTVIGSPTHVGSEPYSISITPNGKFAYIANYNNNTVSVINTNSYTFSEYTANTYNLVENTSGNQNYTSATSSKSFAISKATIIQVLTSNPPSSFTYSGSVPTITDTLTALTGELVSGQSGLSFTLDNNSVSTGSTGSSTLSSSGFTFLVPAGKYAAAGSYSFTSTSGGNSNYTVTTSPTLSVTIDKATPTLTLAASLANFTYNGTAEKLTGSITTVNNQLTAELYINGISVSNPYSNASAGNYVAVYNTSGNQNYTSYSTTRSRRINSIGSVIPIFTPITQTSIDVTRINAKTTYLNLIPKLYLASSVFSSINISFATGTNNLTFLLDVEDNPNVTSCNLSNVPDYLGGIKLQPSINESNVINGAVFNFVLGLNGEGRVSNYNLPPGDVALYKCNVQNSRWTRLSTSYSVGKTTVTYTALSDSLSDYAIGASGTVTTKISESGLPSAYRWNATYGGFTQSANAPNYITFNTTPGLYPLTVYHLSNVSSNLTTVCTTTYSPVNFSAGTPQNVSAGSSMQINYNKNIQCSRVLPSPTSNRSYIMYGIAAIVVVSVIVYMLIRVLQTRRLYKSKK